MAMRTTRASIESGSANSVNLRASQRHLVDLAIEEQDQVDPVDQDRVVGRLVQRRHQEGGRVGILCGSVLA